MSMPKFPEFDPDITCEHSLNMILVSIAMEELALSHIINAEGEKLQYVLGTLETDDCIKPDIDEVLKVNQSVTCLLDSVSQNQMILKSKMDKALHALAEVCPKPPKPPYPPGPPGPKGDQGPVGPPGPACKCPCKCSASFKAVGKCKLWCPDTALHWDAEHLHGRCVGLNPCDKTKIELCSEGRFVVSFSVNVRANGCNGAAAISLQMMRNYKRKDVYTVRSLIPCDNKTVTISMGGIIIDNSEYDSCLSLKLESPDSLIVEDSLISIVEV